MANQSNEVNRSDFERIDIRIALVYLPFNFFFGAKE